MKKAVHQFHTHVFPRDAIGANTMALQEGLIKLGFYSHLFCQSRADELSDRTLLFKHYSQFSSPDNVIIIHYCFKTTILDGLLSLPDRKILLYHNITPARFFEKFSPRSGAEVRQARGDLKKLVGKVELVVGDSAFNLRELREMGFDNGAVIPILTSPEQNSLPPDPETVRKLKKENTINWLFVGRIAPNKKQEDLIKIFYYYHKYINPESRLILVGNPEGMELYFQYLQKFVSYLGLRKSVVFTGSVSQSALAAYYSVADLFVVMSEHEGFCVPVLEAMEAEIPILSYDSSALGETLGGCGVLVKEKKFPQISELAHYILQDREFRENLVDKQSKRLQEFSPEKTLRKWREHLDPFFS